MCLAFEALSQVCGAVKQHILTTLNGMFEFVVDGLHFFDDFVDLKFSEPTLAFWD